MKTITIRSAANGFMATFSPSPEDPLGHLQGQGPYVFESFGSLKAWLHEQLVGPRSDRSFIDEIKY